MGGAVYSSWIFFRKRILLHRTIGTGAMNRLAGSLRRLSGNRLPAWLRLPRSAPDVEPDKQRLGKLAALGGVRQFPARVKCANLAWHTLHEALQGSGDAVSTD